jgi:hypothetical protein
MNNQRSRTWVSLFTAFALLLSPLGFAAAKSPETAVYIGSKDKAKNSSSLSAHTTPVSLILENIQIVKKSEESSSEEIYMNITEYSSVDKPSMHRVPEYPSHWLSKFSDKIKDIPIWNKSIQDGESVELIISVVESDAPPWDVDDLIGSVKLKVYIEKGKLEQEWSIPNKQIVKTDGERDHFILTGDGAEYKISLNLKLDQDKNKNKPKKQNNKK